MNIAANQLQGGANWDFYNLRLTGTQGSMFRVGANGKAVNLKVTNTSTSAGGAAILLASGGVLILNCEAVSYRGVALSASTFSFFAEGNYFHDSDTLILSSATTSPIFVLNNL